MSLYQELKTHLTENSEIEGEPENITIEQKGDVFEVDFMKYSESDDYVYDYFRVELERNSELGGRIEEVFEDFRSRISVSDVAEIDYSSLRLANYENLGIFKDDITDFEEDNKTSETDFIFFVSIDAEFDTVQSEELAEHLLERIREYDTDVQLDDIDGTVAFSDFEVNELVSIKGHIKTDKPHEFVDVSSLEEFLEKSRKYDDESQDIKAPFRLGEGENWEITNEETREIAEETMEGYFESLVDITGEHVFEGECIYFSEGSEIVKMFVHIKSEEIYE